MATGRCDARPARSWAPPAAGAYLFRLNVSDRAGNTQRRYASAEVRFGSPLVNLRQDHRAVSPNGDGTQDALGLSFTVVRETCSISIPDGDSLIYVDRVETSWPLRLV